MQKSQKMNPQENKKTKETPRNDTTNTIIYAKGHCNRMAFSQKGSGQEVEEIEHIK